MVITYKKYRRRWLIEVWDDPVEKLSGIDAHSLLLEDQYVEINKWCVDAFGYHARTAYNIFKLNEQKHLEFFLLRWL
jgi:hypothetical protein